MELIRVNPLTLKLAGTSGPTTDPLEVVWSETRDLGGGGV